MLKKPQHVISSKPSNVRLLQLKEPPVDHGSTTKALIDNRAGSKQLLNIWPLSTIAASATLQYGDILLSGDTSSSPATPSHITIAIEVKTVEDFLSSINSLRFVYHQARGMLSAYDSNHLAIYGRCKTDANGCLLVSHGHGYRPCIIGKNSSGFRQASMSMLNRAIISISQCGMQVSTFESIEQLAYHIFDMAIWWSKPYYKHKLIKVPSDNLYTPHTKTKSPKAVAGLTAGQAVLARMLMGISGVGVVKARQMALHFQSMHNLANSSAHEIQAAGVGTTIADAVYRALRDL